MVAMTDSACVFVAALSTPAVSYTRWPATGAGYGGPAAIVAVATRLAIAASAATRRRRSSGRLTSPVCPDETVDAPWGRPYAAAQPTARHLLIACRSARLWRDPFLERRPHPVWGRGGDP